MIQDKHHFIIHRLEEKFGAIFSDITENHGLLSLTMPPDMNLKILNHLYDLPSLQFTFLTDLTAIHYPQKQDKELCVVYHLHNLKKNIRLQLKAYLPQSQAEIFTATKLFSSANWMERETYDFFGIIFIGHPNMKRILNVDEMNYFPLRKEYQLEDQTRKDKDDEMFGRISHS